MPTFTEPPTGGKGQIRPPLRLVHPAPPKPPKKPRRRHSERVFTVEEQQRLRAALASVRRTWTRPKLAAAMECAECTLFDAEKGRGAFSPALAVRLARVAGVSLDDILRPGLRVVGEPPRGEGAA